MATNSPKETLEERLLDAIASIGGKAEDIRYLTGSKLITLAGSLAIIGRDHRKNTFMVDPINTIKGNTDYFNWVFASLEKAAFKKVLDLGKKEIILIPWIPGYTAEEMLEEIDQQGFISAPAPYVLGLGIQFPDYFQTYGYVTSLDSENLFLNEKQEIGYLCIGGVIESNLDVKTDRFTDEWWFAVIRKES